MKALIMEVLGYLTINRFSIMKKILSIIAIAMLTFASCSNEEFTQDAPNNFSTLTATIEQSPSNARIVVGDDNSLAWSEGDAIRVFMKEVDQNNCRQHYDYVYSNGKNPFGVEGQMLHAKRLQFVHPITEKKMEFEADLPEYFKEVLEKLKN